MSTRSKPVNDVEVVLTYLQHRVPEYPFDAETDKHFIEELVEDFRGVDVLEEIKSFRWYNDRKSLAHLRSKRLALRRWIARSKKRPPN